MTTVYRSVTYRLLPGSAENANYLAQVAGACRYVWNQVLADVLDEVEAGEKPSVSTYSLNLRFTKLRRSTDWLQELPCHPVRYTLKYQADAWKEFFRGTRGKPRFKARHRCVPSFTIPGYIKIEDGRLLIPKLGYLKLSRRGGNPHPDGKPKQVTVKQVLGKWYAIVLYETGDDRCIDNGLSVGMDMNVRQVATSDGEIHLMPDVARLEARRRRYQRAMARKQKGSCRYRKYKLLAAKAHRKIARVRHDWQHRTSRKIANGFGTVAVEDLNTRGMTASAKGTVDNPGKNVRQKAGLNREILATGWGQLRWMLEYKAANTVAVDPRYTSQTCSQCGYPDPRNRKSQSRFECRLCEVKLNADVNAALNILASGTEASGRREAFPLGTSTTRQNTFVWSL